MLAFGDSITRGGDTTDPWVYGYVAVVARTLGLEIDNRSVGGALMYVDQVGVPSIQTQILAATPPSQYETVLMICGTNDMGLYGADAGALAAFKASLQTCLLHLTSRRRIPEPKTERERILFERHQLPSVPAGPSVWVGNTPKQIPGMYIGGRSEVERLLYAGAVADTVAAVSAQHRRVYLVDVASAYDPVTMDGSLPSGIHPNNTGHAAIAAAFLARMREAR